MFVGLDIRSIRSLRCSSMPTVSRVNGSAVERLGAAAHTGDAIEPFVAEVASAVHARQTTIQAVHVFEVVW